MKVARRLGEYLACDPAAISAAVASRASSKDRRIGQLLLERGVITADQLDHAVRSQRIDRLRACPLFADASDSQIAGLLAMVAEVSVPIGFTFIEQGTFGDCFYIVASGRAEVVVKSETSEESHLAFIDAGQTIGEMGYFTQGRRTASVRAAEASELLAIYYRDLPRCFEMVPTLAAGFLRTLTGRLNELNSQYQATVARSRVSEQSLKHLTEYLDLSEHLSLGTGIEALIDRVVKTASRLLNADRASLFLVDPGSGELWSKVAQGAEVREIRVPAGAGIVGWVATYGHSLNIPDAYDDNRFDPATDKRTGYHTKSILCGPVRNLAGDIIGVIQVINKANDGVFGEIDEQLFKAFAHQAAIAVENFNLYRKLVASHEKMAIMLDVATSMAETLDLPALLRKICAKVTQVLQCDRSSFFVHDREAGQLWSMEATGSGLQEIRFPATAGLAGHTARTAEVLNISDAYADERFNRAFDTATGYRTRSVLCVPTVDRSGNVVGVTQAINKIGGSFQEEDVALLKAISSQIAVALENAQLYARTAAMKNYLESVQQSISNSILTLDDQYRVVTANRAALKLLNATPETAIKKDLRDVLGPGNEYLLRLMKRVYSKGENTGVTDLDLSIDGRKTSTVNATVLPLKNDEEKHQGLVVVLEDITREKRVKSLLVKKMSKDVVERLLSDPQLQKLGGQRSNATVLFSDIREFTGLSEASHAEEIVELLNSYFTVMVDEVEKNSGVLDKFIGDAIMAVFGVPFSDPEDPAKAVRTALRMRDALVHFNADRAKKGQKPIQIGIGINTGELVYGNIGSESRSDFTVIGDTVNLASRLEGLNKQYGTQILVTEFTRDLLGDAFRLRLVDHVRVKGKSTPTAIHEVIGDRHVPLTPGQQVFADAYALYKARDFGRAGKLFASAADSDGPCRVFAERCDRLVANPPEDEWDGVWELKSK